MPTFGLYGDGYAAQRHKEAIRSVGGVLSWIYDPKFSVGRTGAIPSLFNNRPVEAALRSVDYIVIASPNHFHYDQVKEILRASIKPGIICEKPLCLPWQPIIDDDRINVCLELRYIPDLPARADIIRAVMVRDEAFFRSWKGDARKAGGNLYEFFIHYVDLAILLGADFEGEVKSEGKQIREIVTYNEKTLDIMKINLQDLYNRMYSEILAGRGIRPKDIMYLMWVLNQNSAKYGYRYSGFGKPIKIGRELL